MDSRQDKIENIDLHDEIQFLEKNIDNLEISFYGFKSIDHSNQFMPNQRFALLNKSTNLLKFQMDACTTYIGNFKRQIQEFIFRNKSNNANYETPKLLIDQMEQLSSFQQRLSVLEPILKQRKVNDAHLRSENASQQEQTQASRLNSLGN